jgi:hypothetical protein
VAYACYLHCTGRGCRVFCGSVDLRFVLAGSRGWVLCIVQVCCLDEVRNLFSRFSSHVYIRFLDFVFSLLIFMTTLLLVVVCCLICFACCLLCFFWDAGCLKRVLWSSRSVLLLGTAVWTRFVFLLIGLFSHLGG